VNRNAKPFLLISIFLAFDLSAYGAIFPQISPGGNWEGVLIIVNKTNLPWDGEALLKQGKILGMLLEMGI